MRLSVVRGKVHTPYTIEQKQCRRLNLYMYILKNLIDIIAEKNMSSNVHKLCHENYPNAIQVNLFLS